MLIIVLNVNWDAIQNKPFFFFSAVQKQVPVEQKLAVGESAKKSWSGGRDSGAVTTILAGTITAAFQS